VLYDEFFRGCWAGLASLYVEFPSKWTYKQTYTPSLTATVRESAGRPSRQRDGPGLPRLSRRRCSLMND
jgi:hypothetical protein